jgi:hypothetical protein
VQQALITTRKELNARERRDMASLLDKIESIGTESEQSVMGLKIFDLGEDGGIVHLENSEFRLLNECIEAAPMRAGGIRPVVRTQDWLDGLRPTTLKVEKGGANADAETRPAGNRA